MRWIEINNLDQIKEYTKISCDICNEDHEILYLLKDLSYGMIQECYKQGYMTELEKIYLDTLYDNKR